MGGSNRAGLARLPNLFPPRHAGRKSFFADAERAFGRKGGGVIGVRWLLKGYRRRGKAFSSLVVFLKRVVTTATDMYLRVRGRKQKVEEYLWDRRSTKLNGW